MGYLHPAWPAFRLKMRYLLASPHAIPPNRRVERTAVSWEDGSLLLSQSGQRETAMTYRAPINDMLLALNHGAGLQAAVKAGHYGDFDADITAAVLEEAGRFASDVLAPLNRVGDENGIKLEADKVTTAPGWPDAYQRWSAAGWPPHTPATRTSREIRHARCRDRRRLGR